MKQSYVLAYKGQNNKAKRVEVFNKIPHSNQNLVHLLKKDFNLKVTSVIHERLFLITPGQSSFSDADLNYIAKEILTDPITESFRLHEDSSEPSFDYVVTINFKPGVTDNLGRATEEALFETMTFAREGKLKVFTGSLYYIKLENHENWPKKVERIIKEFTKKELANPLIQSVKVESAKDFLKSCRFTNVNVPEVILPTRPSVLEIPFINKSLNALVKMNRDNCWALSKDELLLIKKYFTSKETAEKRGAKGLCQNPTDVEIEIIAQTWSEHCKHKIFNAEIEYNHEKIPGVFSTYIKGTTEKIKEKFPDKDYLISLFKDNAGIICFHPEDGDEALEISIKVETHNAPSALDPYGGALTGILGVNRDILGVGLGSKPVANTDVFCVGDFYGEQDVTNHLPEGVIPPKKILKGIHEGVKDGGNKSGIPTVNGSITMHPDYGARPLVFCGTIGVHQKKNQTGLEISKKYAKVNDLIFVGGGAIGRDGIHGATFSSIELDEHSPQNAVQIGDPITQKKLLDFTLKARDLGLFSAITDNGAGGLSSSVGEMAQLTNGATIDLYLNPTKYANLIPWEMMISEAQERMTYGVPRNKRDEFKALALEMGVDVREIGHFTNSGYLEIFYNKERCAYLPLDFIHEGLPKMELKAVLDYETYKKKTLNSSLNHKVNLGAKSPWNHDIKKVIHQLLKRPNIVSKESFVRQYDHEVQGATKIKPFMGKSHHGPSDAAVLLTKTYHNKNRGIAISSGLSPHLSLLQADGAYHMAQHALDEAMRNMVAVGANPHRTAFVDNFCFPSPLENENNSDAHHKLAMLVESCKGLQDLALIYGTPLVSGKDSMKNDYQGKEMRSSIPPTLLMTGIADIPNEDKTMTSGFKNPNDLIYVLGKGSESLLGSEIGKIYQLDHSKTLERGKIPQVDGVANFKLYEKIHQFINRDFINSCHDISEGGLLISLIESTFSNNLGATLNLSTNEWNSIGFLFGEAPGRFVISLPSQNQSLLEKELQESRIEFHNIGLVSSHFQIDFLNQNLILSGDELMKSWRSF